MRDSAAELRRRPTGPGWPGSPAMTLHRLLRPHPGNSTRFRHHRGNRLPHDVVVVDESSMVSLTMMARLLEAVRPDARLVLVGDPDQLVLGRRGRGADRPGPRLRGPRRHPRSPRCARRTASAPRSAPLAEALRVGDADAALEVLRGRARRRSSGSTDADPASAIRAHGAAGRPGRPGRRRGRRRAAGPSPRSTGTGCCARTATAPTAYATGTGGSSSGWPPETGDPLYERDLPRPPAAGHRQRLRAGHLQRRHRRRGGDARRRPPGRDRRRRRRAARLRPVAGSATSRPCTR